MTKPFLLLLAAGALVLAVACGGGNTKEATSETTAGPSPVASATWVPVAPAQRCAQLQKPAPSQTVDIHARWKGKDRVVVEGTAKLPGPGTVSYFFCQDGQVTAALVPAKQPTFSDDKIQAESKLVEPTKGPPFDPNARFDAIVAVVGVTGVPFFIISIPVEGSPG